MENIIDYGQWIKIDWNIYKSVSESIGNFKQRKINVGLLFYSMQKIYFYSLIFIYKINIYLFAINKYLSFCDDRHLSFYNEAISCFMLRLLPSV